MLNSKNKFKHRPGRLEDLILTRSKIFSHLSATVLAGLLVAILSQFPLHALSGMFIDLIFRIESPARPLSDVVLVAYNDDSSARFGGSTKIPVQEISDVFDRIAADKPLAIALLASVNEKIYSDQEMETLSTHFSQIPNTYVGYTDDESLGKNAPVALRHSAHYLPGFVSRDTFSFGADSVSRRVMVSIDGHPTVFIKLAQLYHDVKKDAASTRSQSFERFNNSVQTYINWQGPAGTYPLIPSYQVATGQTKPGTFTGKIVLFSSALDSKKGADHIFTPFSRNHFSTTLLEGAANGLTTLIRKDGISRTSQLVNIFLMILFAVTTVNVVLFLPPGRGIFFVGSELIVLFTAAWILLDHFHLWLDVTHPLLASCIGYYLVIPYRLVDEYRKRWHYQEKSELMSQLEKLKSNFLSLISHDLKTPIARIQGNAELALGDSSKMSEDQKSSLDAIIHTTEDLSRYVETVLDLTRTETSEVPIQKISKDINAVVAEVVETHRYLAEEKNIQINSICEPMFSFRFDPKLIRQVITNLFLNAIKYSPKNTQITIRTVEENGWVKVEIADQGYGIPVGDQEKVFEKFYRVQGQATQETKGTGLGLYLVKYFVELHDGVVNLVSEEGKGSTFTIALPV